MSPAEMLAEFHAGIAAARPQNQADPELRRKLLIEEVRELLEALESGNEQHIAKEAADVIYVGYGTGEVLGLPIDAVFAEVHRSNMTKLDEPVFAPDGKLLKGPNYRPPDVAKVLEAT